MIIKNRKIKQYKHQYDNHDYKTMFNQATIIDFKKIYVIIHSYTIYKESISCYTCHKNKTLVYNFKKLSNYFQKDVRELLNSHTEVR
jgi:hypothetical protein